MIPAFPAHSQSYWLLRKWPEGFPQNFYKYICFFHIWTIHFASGTFCGGFLIWSYTFSPAMIMVVSRNVFIVIDAIFLFHEACQPSGNSSLNLEELSNLRNAQRLGFHYFQVLWGRGINSKFLTVILYETQRSLGLWAFLNHFEPCCK